MLGEDADALGEEVAREDDPLRAVRPDDPRRGGGVTAELVVETEHLLNDITPRDRRGVLNATQRVKGRSRRCADNRNRDFTAVRGAAVKADAERPLAATSRSSETAASAAFSAETSQPSCPSNGIANRSTVSVTP